MADLDERLSQLLSDPAAMERLTELARVLQTRQNSADPAANIPANPSPETEEGTPLTAVLSNLLSTQPPVESPQNAPRESPSSPAAPLLTLLPQLMQALSGNGDFVKRERVNLLQAMRPYLKDRRTDSIERAIKMANITKAATLAMHELGR
ncbi:MAG: hypothetical protein IKU58_03845 [Clostridia bacterium]|nr:hypothetical protein [Clostridia bacterium]